MKFCDETRPLFLETGVSGVGLGAGLLQIRNVINCPQDEKVHNSTLRPIAFAGKSLLLQHRQALRTLY